MPLQETSGAASYDAFGGGAAAGPAYIEDVFSTWLYTGNAPTGQTIVNGIDLAGKGGLTWIKSRGDTGRHVLTDTARGVAYQVYTNLADAQNNTGGAFDVTSFNNNGFTLGTNGYGTNFTNIAMASWTFRKQPKFFDVVTWTGNGANRTIAHSLGSVPGCIIVKRTDATADWQVYHRSLANTEYMVLNSTAAKATGATRWNSTTPTSTVFSLGTDATVNASGGTYVAYVYAHDAGGFGLTGTDNVISCGSLSQSGSSVTVNLGYEPEWLLAKQSGTTGGWFLIDNKRGWRVNDAGAYLQPDTSDTESTGLGSLFTINSTGFSQTGGSLTNWIYIAIRRGPMKVPTTGTSVYNAPLWVGNNATKTLTSGFPPDLAIGKQRTVASNASSWVDRLRGITASVLSSATTAEQTINPILSFGMDGITIGADTTTGYWNYPDNGLHVGWFFRRAPGFFDEVCYTGSGVARTVAHNLAAVPELMIVKGRSGATAWQVYSSALANTEYLVLNTTAAKATGATRWNSTTPTNTVFSLGTASEVNTSAATYVAYLFASCPGVSKVFSYTGNGSSQNINCGFTGGARFILIKRTDSTGNWYVWDTARGIVSANDPYLALNSLGADDFDGASDSVDAFSSGFTVNQDAVTNINVNAATYIGLAIA